MAVSDQSVDERLRQLDKVLTDTLHIAVVKFLALNNRLFTIGICWPGGRPVLCQYDLEEDRTGSDKSHFTCCVSECDDEV